MSSYGVPRSPAYQQILVRQEALPLGCSHRLFRVRVLVRSKLEDDGDDDRYSASIECAWDERPFPGSAERLIVEA